MVSILAPLARGALLFSYLQSNFHVMFQSSPLSQEGRYGPFRITRDGEYLFQSSPLSQEGRYIRGQCTTIYLFSFNPRPSRKRGATGGGPGRVFASAGFNPRPSRKRGATVDRRELHRRATGFNPRPSRKRGATRRAEADGIPVLCFNPRPSRKRGATIVCRQASPEFPVSILAPLARGALQNFFHVESPESQFQSSPLSQEGRYFFSHVILLHSLGFNPRPSRKRGATPGNQAGRVVPVGFNPRPSRKRGATHIDFCYTPQ